MSEETTAPLEDRIKLAIDEIRPFLQQDGGNIEFISLENNVVNVQLQGACAHCPGAQMTLKNGVERKIKETCPEIISVESV